MAGRLALHTINEEVSLAPQLAQKVCPSHELATKEPTFLVQNLSLREYRNAPHDSLFGLLYATDINEKFSTLATLQGRSVIFAIRHMNDQ